MADDFSQDLYGESAIFLISLDLLAAFSIINKAIPESFLSCQLTYSQLTSGLSIIVGIW